MRPEKTPAEETSQDVVLIARVFEPHPIVTAPVDVPVLILVAKLEDALKLFTAPKLVNQTEVKRPESANTISPVPS